MQKQAALVAQTEPANWLDDTPGRDESYQLAMFVDGVSEQFIPVTREEYIRLKSALAQMRGLMVQAV